MFGSRHHFMLAPMDTLSFNSVPDPTAAAIDTGMLELPPRYEVAQSSHILMYPTREESRAGKKVELEITFRVRRVTP